MLKYKNEITDKLQELIQNDFVFRTPGEGSDIDVPNVPDTEYKTSIGFPGFTQSQPGSGIETTAVGSRSPNPTFGKAEPFKEPKKDVVEEAPLGKAPIPDIKQKEPADIWKKTFSGESSVLSKEDKKILQEPPPQTPKASKDDLKKSASKGKVLLGGDDGVKEQNEDPEKKSAKGSKPKEVSPDPEPKQDAQGQQPNAGMGTMNPNAGMADPYGGMGPANPYGPQENPVQTAEEIGRIYELKKIYSRLLSIEEHLSTSSDEVLLKLKEYVTKVVELFETVISNVEPFRDKIDDIIVIFYKFLESVYGILKRYYEMKKMEEKMEKEETLPSMKIANIMKRYRDKKGQK